MRQPQRPTTLRPRTRTRRITRRAIQHQRMARHRTHPRMDTTTRPHTRPMEPAQTTHRRTPRNAHNHPPNTSTHNHHHHRMARTRRLHLLDTHHHQQPTPRTHTHPIPRSNNTRRRTTHRNQYARNRTRSIAKFSHSPLASTGMAKVRVVA